MQLKDFSSCKILCSVHSYHLIITKISYKVYYGINNMAVNTCV